MGVRLSEAEITALLGTYAVVVGRRTTSLINYKQFVMQIDPVEVA